MHGTIGLIATNTIAQGDTRQTGLQWLLANGANIYDARDSLQWPGDSAVTVSTVHLALGQPRDHCKEVALDARRVPTINSRLRPTPERANPRPLPENSGSAFVGTYVLGMGFTLTPTERDALVAKDPRNAERIFPYLGGQEVNTSPTHAFERYVINFEQLSLAEAERWPELINIVREKVKPERDKLRDTTADGRDYKARWWQHAKIRRSLEAALAPLAQCLVTSYTSKHRVFARQSCDKVFDQTLIVFTN
jgi:hypothetical protein